MPEAGEYVRFLYIGLWSVVGCGGVMRVRGGGRRINEAREGWLGDEEESGDGALE